MPGLTYAITWKYAVLQDYLGAYQILWNDDPTTNRWQICALTPTERIRSHRCTVVNGVLQQRKVHYRLLQGIEYYRYRGGLFVLL